MANRHVRELACVLLAAALLAPPLHAPLARGLLHNEQADRASFPPNREITILAYVLGG